MSELGGQLPRQIREELLEHLVALLADRASPQRRDASGDLVSTGHHHVAAAALRRDGEIERGRDARRDLTILAGAAHMQRPGARVGTYVDHQIGTHPDPTDAVLD